MDNTLWERASDMAQAIRVKDRSALIRSLLRRAASLNQKNLKDELKDFME